VKLPPFSRGVKPHVSRIIKDLGYNTLVITHTDDHTPLWQWGCLLLLVACILLVLVAGLWLLTKPAAVPTDPRPTAIVWTATPTPTPTATPTPTPTATPTLPASPTEVGVGVRVRVVGTGAAGLSIRASASVAAERIEVAAEGEVFLVVDGPQFADDLTWWRLRDEANPQREGWAAADYLTVAGE